MKLIITIFDSSFIIIMITSPLFFFFFFFNDTATTEIYTLSLHDALPISGRGAQPLPLCWCGEGRGRLRQRSEEHTSELQSQSNLVCRLLLEKKKKNNRLTCDTVLQRINLNYRQ